MEQVRNPNAERNKDASALYAKYGRGKTRIENSKPTGTKDSPVKQSGKEHIRRANITD